jgi:hypothetical protein
MQACSCTNGIPKFFAWRIEHRLISMACVYVVNVDFSHQEYYKVIGLACDIYFICDICVGAEMYS